MISALLSIPLLPKSSLISMSFQDLLKQKIAATQRFFDLDCGSLRSELIDRNLELFGKKANLLARLLLDECDWSEVVNPNESNKSTISSRESKVASWIQGTKTSLQEEITASQLHVGSIEPLTDKKKKNELIIWFLLAHQQQESQVKQSKTPKSMQKGKGRAQPVVGFAPGPSSLSNAANQSDDDDDDDDDEEDEFCDIEEFATGAEPLSRNVPPVAVAGLPSRKIAAAVEGLPVTQKPVFLTLILIARRD